MRTSQHPRGFTLIEISLTLLISGMLIALVTANYRRANQDSLLQREASLLLSRLRLTQETTGAGTQQFFCQHYTSRPCTCRNFENGICRSGETGNGCVGFSYCCPRNGSECSDAKPIPPGGYMLTFSCPGPKLPNGTIDPSIGWGEAETGTLPLFLYGESTYYQVADRQTCFNAGVNQAAHCFPPHYDTMDSDGPPVTDGLSSLFANSSDPSILYKGDTVMQRYTLPSALQVKDIRVNWQKSPVGFSKNWVHCGEASPWQDKSMPNPATGTGPRATIKRGSPGNHPYPIMANIRYLQPDGRSIAVSDNISPYAPLLGGGGVAVTPDPSNPVTSVELLLALKERPTNGCRRITITSQNVITQNTDADCDFNTAL